MSGRETLAERWDSYLRDVMPKNASAVQKEETLRAFYAGAKTMFSLITDGLDADKDPTDGDVAYVESLNQELLAFYRRMASASN